MSTLREIIDAYEAREAARTFHLTGSGVATIPGPGPSGDESGPCAQTATSLPASTFGAVLMRYRAASGLSRPQLARAVGVDPSYVWLMERGRRLPSLALTLRLADVLVLGSMQRTKLLAGAGFVGSARCVS